MKWEAQIHKTSSINLTSFCDLQIFHYRRSAKVHFFVRYPSQVSTMKGISLHFLLSGFTSRFSVRHLRAWSKTLFVVLILYRFRPGRKTWQIKRNFRHILLRHHRLVFCRCQIRPWKSAVCQKSLEHADVLCCAESLDWSAIRLELHSWWWIQQCEGVGRVFSR